MFNNIFRFYCYKFNKLIVESKVFNKNFIFTKYNQLLFMFFFKKNILYFK